MSTGVSDGEASDWLRGHSRVQDALAITKWNRSMRDHRLSELPDQHQQYLAQYLPKFCPEPNKVRFLFDVYDAPGRPTDLTVALGGLAPRPLRVARRPS